MRFLCNLHKNKQQAFSSHPGGLCPLPHDLCRSENPLKWTNTAYSIQHSENRWVQPEVTSDQHLLRPWTSDPLHSCKDRLRHWFKPPIWNFIACPLAVLVSLIKHETVVCVTDKTALKEASPAIFCNCFTFTSFPSPCRCTSGKRVGTQSH